MRVRPEVSELSSEGSLRLNGFEVPAITTRRAETTVEMGSGQSFMLAGLLRASNNNTIDKAPFLGDLPILGALFRSSRYRKAETELVIIVTPYLVRPVNGRLATPVDGYRTPRDGNAVFEGQTFNGVSGPRPVGAAPRPSMSVGAGGAASAAAAAPQPVAVPGFKL
jgi:pilus assembly protein CpaC